MKEPQGAFPFSTMMEQPLKSRQCFSHRKRGKRVDWFCGPSKLTSSTRRLEEYHPIQYPIRSRAEFTPCFLVFQLKHST